MDYETQTETCIEGMRGTVILAHDCVGQGATLVSPVKTLPVRNNKVYWLVLKQIYK